MKTKELSSIKAKLAGWITVILFAILIITYFNTGNVVFVIVAIAVFVGGVVIGANIEQKVDEEKQKVDEEKRIKDYEARIMIDLEIKKQEKIKDKIKKKQEGEKKRILVKLKDKKNKQKVQLLSKYDKNEDGIVDEIEEDIFFEVLKRNQSELIEIEKNKVHQFIKLSSYLKTKKSNIQSIYKIIHDFDSELFIQNYNTSGYAGNSVDKTDLTDLSDTLNSEIKVYKSLVFHSLNMIVSLKKGDLITFYEIYEMFDKLGVFNSNWENEVSNKLSNIESGIGRLIQSINRMNDEIVGELTSLNYIVDSSISSLEASVNYELQGIKSSVDFNNLLTSVNTYQLSKLNSRTNKLLKG